MEKNNIIVRTLIIVVLITNISQLPFFIDMGITSFISSFMWLLMLLVLIIKNKLVFKNQEIKFILLGILFMVGTLFAELITSYNHLLSNLIIPFYSSLIIFFVGTNSSNSFTERDLLKLCYSYIISILIISIFIYFEVFSGGFNWASVGYSYPSKNSISQMIFTGIIFLGFLYKPESLTLKLLKYGVLIFLLTLLLALKSRATIISLFFIPIVFLWSPKIQNKHKIKYILLAIGIFVLILNNQLLREIIIDNVLLGSRSGASLNEITSGRVEHITVYFPFFIQGNELLGTGTIYVESFPFNVLLRHGVLVGWILILVAYWPLVWGIKNVNNNKFSIVFLLISFSYSLNSIFEAQSPFGPGTKTYILWLMFGLLYGIKRNENKKDVIKRVYLH